MLTVIIIFLEVTGAVDTYRREAIRMLDNKHKGQRNTQQHQTSIFYYFFMCFANESIDLRRNNQIQYKQATSGGV